MLLRDRPSHSGIAMGKNTTQRGFCELFLEGVKFIEYITGRHRRKVLALVQQCHVTSDYHATSNAAGIPT